jgi:hypothetical protein
MADANLADLAANVSEASEPVKRHVTRTRKPNPFEALLKASHEDGKARQTRELSEAQRDEVVKALRRAGRYHKIGVRLEFIPGNFGRTIVKFQGVDMETRGNGDDATEPTEQDATEDATEQTEQTEEPQYADA